MPLVLLAVLSPSSSRRSPAIACAAATCRRSSGSSIERAQLAPDGIVLSVLNDGPDPVTIAQVPVDDAYWAFTASNGTVLKHLGRTTLTIPYPWVAGEAHLVKILTSTGTPFEHEIAVAVESPRPDGRYFLTFALIGLYVGVIPVALGLLWFPLASRVGPAGLDVLLALTIGLLAFLLVDAIEEGSTAARIARRRRFRGTALFVGRGGCGAYLALDVVGAWLQARRARRAATAGSPGAVLALLVAVGHRPAQLRRRAGDRRGVRARRSGARHAADHRLHAAQHDRGARHRRADREGAAVVCSRWCGSGDRRRPDDRRRVARRSRLLAGRRRAVPRVSAPARSRR